MRRSVAPELVVLFAVLAVSSSAILIRLSGVHYVAAAGYRMLFTVVLTVPLLLRSAKAPPSSAPQAAEPEVAALGATPPEGTRTPRRRVVLLSAVSGLFLALHFGFWFKSLQLTSVSAATVLVNTHPLFVMLLGALFLRESVGRRAAVWMLAAMAGSAGLSLTGTGFGETALEGNLLAFGGALFVSVYFLIGRRLRREVSVIHYTFGVYLVTATILLAYGFLTGVDLGPYAPREYVIFGAMAVFPTLLGHSLFNWALKYLRTSLVSTAILGEPVFATLLAMLLFAEFPSPMVLLFGALVLYSVFRFSRADRPARPVTPATLD